MIEGSAWQCINDCTNTLCTYIGVKSNFSNHIFLNSFSHSFFSFYFTINMRHTEAEKRPLKKIVARAGTNLTLSCDALHEKSILKIDKLTWKLTHTIIVKYTDGKSLDQKNQRVSLLFYYKPSIATDFHLLFFCSLSFNRDF